jgi:pyruvate/2-oxoglutarate dehydrogenase complex dihydrolipoamide dehydrogenase (E3) component
VDFAATMERMRRLRAYVSHHDSAHRFRSLGVDVFLGEATFVDRRTVDVAGATLKFKKAVIATGSRAARPPIEGLEEVGYLTNETVFNLTARPRRLLVIGGGPLGCELPQGFGRLGCDVIIANREPYFLPDEERDAAEILADSLRRDGIDVRLNTEVRSVTRRDGEKRVRLINDGEEATVPVDEILVGAGRVPNVEGLDLEAAGVEYDLEHGVRVNDYLRTTNRRIYAAGDVALERKFTHMADATARIVIQNALFWGRKKLGSLTIPWCTYTDPEIAHVGVYVKDAREQGFPIKTFTVPMSDVDRAVLDGEDEGFGWPGRGDRTKQEEASMGTKVRVNLANAQELLELPGLGTAQVAAIVRLRSEHGPIKDADQLATILSGYPLADTLRERADFSPSDDTAAEAPGA